MHQQRRTTMNSTTQLSRNNVMFGYCYDAVRPQNTNPITIGKNTSPTSHVPNKVTLRDRNIEEHLSQYRYAQSPMKPFHGVKPSTK